MNDKVREIFEEHVFLNFVSSWTGHGLRRKENGEYVSEMLEDHWNTFQDGWECAIAYMKKKDNPQYSDIISDGGMDPR